MRVYANSKNPPNRNCFKIIEKLRKEEIEFDVIVKSQDTLLLKYFGYIFMTVCCEELYGLTRYSITRYHRNKTWNDVMYSNDELVPEIVNKIICEYSDILASRLAGL